MSARIFNREFQHPDDGWYQIEVPGEHLNEKSGVMQVIDSAAVSSIVNRFNQEADDYKLKWGTPFPGMLIDHEHFKHQADKETRAYGWLMRLENRNGIPFGKINWTGSGKPAIDGGDYRFFSSEYDPGDLVILDRSQKPMRVRPMRLDGLTLTNDPNNKGGAPITNRAGTANSKPSQTDCFPTPALDEWFRAVAAVQKSAETNGNAAIYFNTAWEWARQQFPELYAAAFGAAELSDGVDEADKANSSAQVAGLTNRIAKAARKDFQFGWNFMRENLPGVFNRTFSRSEVILNREQQKQHPQAVQERAARLFNRFVSVEQASSKMPHSQAWQCITNRHPALKKLAEGSMTLKEACAHEPELQTRLM